MVRPAGLEPATCGLGSRNGSGVKPSHRNTYDNTDPVLASCLATIRETCPSLATVVNAWPDLPEPIRAAILAVIRSATEEER